MHQLTYISSTTPRFEPDMIDQILRGSRRNNAAVAVTGLLLFDGKRFLQVLEGPREAVDGVYHRLTADERHKAIVILSRKEIEKRQFGDWSMAYRPAGSGDLVEVVSPLVREADPTTKALFESFAAVRGTA